MSDLAQETSRQASGRGPNLRTTRGNFFCPAASPRGGGAGVSSADEPELDDSVNELSGSRTAVAVTGGALDRDGGAAVLSVVDDGGGPTGVRARNVRVLGGTMLRVEGCVNAIGSI